MWNSKGRSGYGEQTINGNYDDWDGLSANGRQVKNELTKETRNLSGADYWFARKANKPEQITPEVWVNGCVNVSAFKESDQPKKPAKKQRHIRNKILPQQTTLDNLDLREKELDEAYLSEEIDDQEYLELSRALQVKRNRAHKSLMKALGYPAEYQTEQALECDLSDDSSEGIPNYRVEGERDSWGHFSLSKVAFDLTIKACRKVFSINTANLIEKIVKNDSFKFLTACVGGAIILLTLAN